MKKRILSIITVLALCLGLLPPAALAADNDKPNNLYVGNQQVISGTETTYWSTNNSGELTQSAENNAWNVKYDPNTVTLTLKNATIEGVYNNVNTSGSGIYAASSSGPVSLNIVLEEENKVSGMYGIDVSSSGGDASLNISGSGSLTVSGLSGNGIGIFMSSQNSANLTIEEASVTALGSQDGGSGVRLITSQTGSPSLTIEVKGGSLQASGETNGIHFLSNVNDATAVANLKVSGNATVKASNIITTKDGTGSVPELKPAASGSDGTGGIIWDGKNGTVYGKVTLQEDLTIGEGESLTIPDEASLNITDGKTLTVNGGELKGNVPQRGVIYKVTGVSLDKTSLTLTEGGRVQLTATVKPSDATDKTVTWSSDTSGIVTITPDTSDSKKATVTATGTGTTTITATADGKSATCTVTVTAKPSPDRPVITRPSSDRISGDDRFETAMETADQLKKELGVTEFSTIVVACSDDFADALSASAFAHEKEAPVLVVNENNEERVKAYIEQNLARGGTVYIMGGSAAVTGGFEDSLSDFDTVRFAGDDRYETNLNTLKELNLTGKEDIIIASGTDFADALSASSTGCPIMIVGERLTEPQIAFLKTLGGDDTYYIAGGTAAVSAEVEEQLRALNAGSVKRLAGEDRYETGVLIAETFYGRTGSVYIASGDDFPDGLTGGVLAGLSGDGKGAPLVLVNENNTERAAEYIDDVNPRSVKAIGGKAAVPEDVLKAVIS